MAASPTCCIMHDVVQSHARCCSIACMMLFNRMYGGTGSAHGVVLISSSLCLLCFLRALCTALSAFCAGRPTRCCLLRRLLGKRCQALLGECCSVGTSLCVLVYNNCCACCTLLPGAAVSTCYNIILLSLCVQPAATAGAADAV